MKKIGLCLALCLVIFGLNTSNVLADTDNPHINVAVVDSATGLPIEGVAIHPWQDSRNWYTTQDGQTDSSGKAIVDVSEIDVSETAIQDIHDVFVAATKDGYYQNFSGNASYWEEASPVVFSQAGEANAVLAMAKIPFGIELWVYGIKLHDWSHVDISHDGGIFPVRARITNRTSRRMRVTAKLVVLGPSKGSTDVDHELNKTLGEKNLLLKPGQSRSVRLVVNMPAGLRDTVYRLAFGVERGWATGERKWFQVCKGDYCSD